MAQSPPPLGLLEPGDLLHVARIALEACGADENEVTVSHEVEATTRFAAEGITQNVLTATGLLAVRALVGARSGRASTTSFTAEDVRQTAARAVEAARLAAEDPEALPLPEPRPARAVDHFDGRTLAESPAERAEHVAAAVARVRASGLRPAGSAVAFGTAHTLATSRGLVATYRSSGASFAMTALSDTSSGWAEGIARSSSSIAHQEITEAALGKALASRDPGTIEPGEYPVVLEPGALADVLLFTGYLGFSGLAFAERRSFLDQLGAVVFSPLVTLRDDFDHPLCGAAPFDGEGVPRRAVTLVEAGRVLACLHDRRSARALGTESTGHALPQPNATGPVPSCLVLEPGTTSTEDLVGSLDRGILITRFHYSNVVDPKRLLLTGMTRDGTFLIERGRVTRPLCNLRFTDTAVRLLAGVEAVGREARCVKALFGGRFVAPAVRIRALSFASATGF